MGKRMQGGNFRKKNPQKADVWRPQPRAPGGILLFVIKLFILNTQHTQIGGSYNEFLQYF